MRRKSILSCVLTGVLTAALLLSGFDYPTGLKGGTNETKMKVYDLRVQNLKSPLGIETIKPTFSWLMENGSANETQTAYQIVVARSSEKLEAKEYDLWDSGKVDDSSNCGIKYDGKELKSGETAYWKVKVWDASGQESDWSEQSSWEMGLLNKEDWKASWISRGDENVINRLLHLPGNSDKYSNVCKDKIGSTTTRYLRLSVSESGPAALDEYNMEVQGGVIFRTQIMELELYKNGEKISWSMTPKVITDNTHTWANQWNKNFLVDQNVLTGYTSNAVSNPVYENPIELTIDFGKQISFDEVRLVCRTDAKSTDGEICANYPKKYQYFTSEDGKTFAKKGEEIDVTNPPSIPVSYDSYAPILSKEFVTSSDKKIAKARLYISGLGLYEAHINGKIVGEGTYFNPGESDPRKTIYYATYDITKNLNTSDGTKNAISFILGNGQYANYRVHKQSGRYYKTDDSRTETQVKGLFGEVKGIAQVVITYQDGSKDVIGTDDSWSFVESPIIENSWYSGEDYDATLEVKDWDDVSPAIDRNEWGKVTVVKENIPTGKMTAREFLPISVSANDSIHSDQIKVSLKRKKDGNNYYLVDMGRNGAGFPEITIDTRIAGQKIQLFPAEVSDFTGIDGHINQESCTQSESKNGNLIYDTYITNDSGKQTYHPRFCYHGYQYLEVVIPSTIAFSNQNVKGYILRTENEKNGSFSCSNEILNRINTLTERSIESNMFGTFTDCPQIEKLGWLETPGLMFYSMSQTYDIRSWIQKIVHDMADSQADSGKIAAIAPEYFRVAYLNEDLNWNGSMIFTAWQYYESYKDSSIFSEKNYQAMKNYITYIEQKVADKNLVKEGQMGEWGEMTEYGKTPTVLVETTAYYRLACTMKKIAEVLGKTNDMSHYDVLSQNIKSAFHRNSFCYNKEHLYGNGTQSGYGCVLYSGICQDENVEQTVKLLVESIEKSGYHLTSGEVGLKQVFTALATNGRSDVVYKMVMNDTMPSYKYFVDQGLTSLPEYWNFAQPWGSAKVIRSRNHAMMGHVKEWLTRYLVGVDPTGIGYDTVNIKPAKVDEISNASGTVPTVHGNVKVEWERSEQNTFSLDVEVPVGITAKVSIPALTQRVAIVCNGEVVNSEKNKDASYHILNRTFGSGKYRILATFTPDSENLNEELQKGSSKKASLHVKAAGYLSKKITLVKGKKLKLKTSSVSPTGKRVKYKSSKKSVATVSSSGVIRAKKAGKTKITVSLSGAKSVSYEVRVVKKPKVVRSFQLKKSKFRLKMGSGVNLACKKMTKNGTSKFSFRSKKKQIAKVDAYGKITARKKGKTTILITCGKTKKQVVVHVIK